MFQFSGLSSARLCVQREIPAHDRRWVPPFGNLRVEAYVRLTVAYRSLSRPSSAPDAKAFPLRPLWLDLAWFSFSRIMQAFTEVSKLFFPLFLQ